MPKPDDPRSLIIKAIQAEHDEVCSDFDCKCHEREWDSDVEAFVSEVAIAKADELIAEIEESAVRKYRGFEE